MKTQIIVSNKIVAQTIDLFKQGLNGCEIGKALNIPHWTARRIVYKEGFKFGHKTPFKSESQIIFDKDFKYFINGSLLGDGFLGKYDLGNISSRKNHNSKLSIRHSLVQEEYLLYKNTILEQFNCKFKVRVVLPRKISHTIKGRVVKDNGSIYTDTIQNVYFNQYRDIWYPNGLKIVPDNLELNDLAIAIWYMDDGYKHKSGGYYFCTDCFTFNDIKKLQYILAFEFNIESTIQSHRRLYISVKSAATFRNLIEKYICTSMKYKL